MPGAECAIPHPLLAGRASLPRAIARLCKAQNFHHVGKVAADLATPDGYTGFDSERNLAIALSSTWYNLRSKQDRKSRLAE